MTLVSVDANSVRADTAAGSTFDGFRRKCFSLSVIVNEGRSSASMTPIRCRALPLFESCSDGCRMLATCRALHERAVWCWLKRDVSLSNCRLSWNVGGAVSDTEADESLRVVNIPREVGLGHFLRQH